MGVFRQGQVLVRCIDGRDRTITFWSVERDDGTAIEARELATDARIVVEGCPTEALVEPRVPWAPLDRPLEVFRRGADGVVRDAHGVALDTWDGTPQRARYL